MSKAISIKNVNVRLENRQILTDVNWDVDDGARYFILGANGAGKTTLVKVLMGYQWPRFGAEVNILGHRYGEIPLPELRKSIAWVSPLIFHWLNNPQWTGLEMVASGLEASIGMFRTITDDERRQAQTILDSLRVGHLIDQPFRTMSSGEQIKVLIARALITHPKLMILDEPNVYLDISGREFLLDTIEKLAGARPDLTIIFISQRIEDILPVFDRGMILKNGRILASGSRDEVLTEENLKRAFDFDIRLIKTKTGRFWTVIDD